MSSIEGYTLESWIKDSFFGNKIQPLHLMLVTKLFDSNDWREGVENSLENFDEEEQSWRTYRNSMWYSYEKETDAPIEAITKVDDPRMLAVMYIFPHASQLKWTALVKKLTDLQRVEIGTAAADIGNQLNLDDEPKFRELFTKWWNSNINQSLFEGILRNMPVSSHVVS